MSEQKAAYSPEFQHFLQLVETALIQSAADARDLAERTGTPFVVRETQEIHETDTYQKSAQRKPKQEWGVAALK